MRNASEYRLGSPESQVLGQSGRILVNGRIWDIPVHAQTAIPWCFIGDSGPVRCRYGARYRQYGAPVTCINVQF